MNSGAWNLACALALLLVVMGTTGCASTNSTLERFEFTAITMGVEARVVLYAGNEQEARGAAQEALGRMMELDQVMSDYRADSELMQLCAKSPGDWHDVSRDLWTVLMRGQAMAEASGGAFDMTAGALTHLWRKARRDKQLPGDEEITVALARGGWRHLEVDPAQPRVKFNRQGMQLDLGGLGKGFAVDEAAATLRARNIDRFLVALAGDIAMGGAPPGEVGWSVALDPGWPGAAAHTMRLENAAISTSGEAMQCFEVDGRTYSHILNPRNGRPIEGRRAVAVLTRDATTSDALATAVSVLGEREARELLGRFDGVRVFMQSPHDVRWREFWP